MSFGKIMIVDDEQEVREALKLNLEGQNYHFVEAENGEEAVQKLKSEDNLVNVGLILCDINMPKVDGVGCIQYIRKEAPGIPIVVVSGNDNTQQAVSLMQMGVKEYLKKPVERENLRSTVHKYVSAGKDIGL